jgi:ABC-type antimicrobial peptide transport system permease subunit
LAEAGAVAGIGITLGLVASVALTRLLTRLLFGVRPGDPVTLLMTALLLAGVALAATLGPALRAGRVDPMQTLRSE